MLLDLKKVLSLINILITKRLSFGLQRVIIMLSIILLMGCNWQPNVWNSMELKPAETASNTNAYANTNTNSATNPSANTKAMAKANQQASVSTDVKRVAKVVAAPNKPYPKQDMMMVKNSLWPEAPIQFDAPELNQTNAKLIAFPLWSTHYRVHITTPIETSAAKGVPLVSMRGHPLVEKLSIKDWCYAALEGTVYVKGYGVYNYAGRGKNEQTDCSPWFYKFKSSLVNAMEQTRFSRVSAPFGTGAKGWWLVPFRSIAVDRKVVKLGSVIYIPSVRGKEVVLPDGRLWLHDGYFLAADTGGAIKTNHIDLFTGFYPDNPFTDLEASEPGKLVSAYIVDNKTIQKQLIKQHKPR